MHHAFAKLVKRFDHSGFRLVGVHAVGDFLLELVGDGLELSGEERVVAQLAQ